MGRYADRSGACAYDRSLRIMVERERARTVVGNAAASLLAFLRRSGFRPVDAEREVEGTFAGLPASALAEESACIKCHRDVTPNVVKDFLSGKMSKADVDCSSCHGSDHKSADDVAKVKLPTEKTCKECHPQVWKQWSLTPHARMLREVKENPDAIAAGLVVGRGMGRFSVPAHPHRSAFPTEQNQDLEL